MLLPHFLIPLTLVLNILNCCQQVKGSDLSSLVSALMRMHLEYCTQYCTKYKKDTDWLAGVNPAQVQDDDEEIRVSFTG